MKRMTATILVLAMALSLAGCANSDPTGQKTDFMEDISAHAVNDYSDTTAGAQAMTEFGVRLAKNSFENGENLLLSPLSVLCALAMTANGAKEQTREQMEEVFGLTTEELNSYLHWYISSLPQGENYKLCLANSIWFTEDSRFIPNQDFLQINADYYGADIYSAPFDNSTLKAINTWIEEKTDGMIKEALDAIPPAAVMYLINALSFDARWSTVYQEHDVRNGIFTKEDGSERNVEMMHGIEYQYLSDDNTTGFLKYYEGRAYAFATLLPEEGISMEEYLRSLTGEKLHNLLSSVQSTPVVTAIPKFETGYSVEMSQLLSGMGMTDAFNSERADFSGMGTSGAGNVFINRVIHKTFISVSEQGTKAGAVTIVEPTDGAAMEPDKRQEVILDRPFVYLLIDCESGVPFFIGVMMDPAQ